MPSGISASMHDEMLKNPQNVFATFEIDLDGTTYKISDKYVKAKNSGMYLKRVSSWDDFDRPGPERSYHRSDAAGGLEVEDHDQVLGKATGGGARGDILHATCRGYWRTDSDEVDPADHRKFFDGRVINFGGGDKRFGFEVGPDLLSLSSENNNIPRINPTDWPNAPEKILEANDGDGTPGQAVYGKHRSAGSAGSNGMVPTIPIDTLNNYWYVSIGKIIKSNFITIYRNTVDETADFTVEWILRNGTFYTVLKHTAGTADQESDTVTVDMDGIDNNGDGFTGTQVDRIDIITHFLTNFVFNAYPAGSIDGESWLDISDAPIDEDIADTADTFFFQRAYSLSKVLTTADVGDDVLNDFCEDQKIWPFWTANWTLGLLPLNHAKLDLNTTRMIRREDVQKDQEPTWTPRTDSLVNRLRATYLKDHAAGSLRQGPISVMDTRRTPIISADVVLDWIRASVT